MSDFQTVREVCENGSELDRQYITEILQDMIGHLIGLLPWDEDFEDQQWLYLDVENPDSYIREIEEGQVLSFACEKTTREITVSLWWEDRFGRLSTEPIDTLKIKMEENVNETDK